MMKANQRGSARLFQVAVLAVLGFAGWAFSTGVFSEGEAQAIEGVAVVRGPLRISEIVHGNLEAKDSVSLNCELEGNSTVLFLIDEGTMVEEGELLAELDVSSMTDRRVAQEITVKNSEAAETKAREQYDIQEIQNESDIASALLKVQFAGIDKEKYIKGDWPLNEQAAKESIQLRKEELERASDQLEWTKKLEDKGFVQRTELEADRLAHERARISHEQAIREQLLMVDYENPRRLAELNADIEERERDLLKIRKQANARLADYRAARDSTAARLGLEREKLAKLMRQLDKAKIHAPEAGMVVYGRSSSRHGSSEPVQVGSSVRERQQIISLPKPGGMVVKASLHETVLEKVEVGQVCLITIDAMRNEVFDGTVEFVALLPDSQSWFADPNQRLYRAEVSMTEGRQDMRPGMSCNVEIFAATLKDVLFIPVQCVFMDGGQSIVFKQGPTGFVATPVNTGLDNSKWVEILGGVGEGDIVALSPPTTFVPRATPLEAETEMPAMSPRAPMGAAAKSGRREMPKGQTPGAGEHSGRPAASYTGKEAGKGSDKSKAGRGGDRQGRGRPGGGEK